MVGASFRARHRIMVHVQGSWSPLYDRLGTRIPTDFATASVCATLSSDSSKMRPTPRLCGDERREFRRDLIVASHTRSVSGFPITAPIARVDPEIGI